MTESQDAPTSDFVQVQTVWDSFSRGTPTPVNQHAIQLVPGPDGMPEAMLITLGFVAPPILTGSRDEQEAQARSLSELTITTGGRYQFTRERAAEMLQGLQAALNLWSQVADKEQETGQ